jgi:hypothetical protein
LLSVTDAALFYRHPAKSVGFNSCCAPRPAARCLQQNVASGSAFADDSACFQLLFELPIK